VIPEKTLRAAEAHLSRRDRTMARLIREYGPCRLGRTRRDPFHTLCTSIISQQLSTKAANTIQTRVATAVVAGARFMPAHFIAVEYELLRSAGLSNAKARWLIGIAQAVHSEEFSFASLRRLDDESAIEALDALPGVGRWTAEMMLIFALDRLDIFSLGDAGLRRAINEFYNEDEKLNDDATLSITERWAPYRSIASWYLWRCIDGEIEF
jgi:DNA-3-methyladenine glycosylase II